MIHPTRMNQKFIVIYNVKTVNVNLNGEKYVDLLNFYPSINEIILEIEFLTVEERASVFLYTNNLASKNEGLKTR